jgi:hypothetical protein
MNDLTYDLDQKSSHAKRCSGLRTGVDGTAGTSTSTGTALQELY